MFVRDAWDPDDWPEVIVEPGEHILDVRTAKVDGDYGVQVIVWRAEFGVGQG